VCRWVSPWPRLNSYFITKNEKRAWGRHTDSTAQARQFLHSEEFEKTGTRVVYEVGPHFDKPLGRKSFRHCIRSTRETAVSIFTVVNLIDVTATLIVAGSDRKAVDGLVAR
jgi:hypothetical protein